MTLLFAIIEIRISSSGYLFVIIGRFEKQITLSEKNYAANLILIGVVKVEFIFHFRFPFAVWTPDNSSTLCLSYTAKLSYPSL